MKHRRAFSLVELLVVIAIIATLIGLLIPALGAAMDAARAARCASNLRQLAVGVNMYADDHRELLPWGHPYIDTHYDFLQPAIALEPYIDPNKSTPASADSAARGREAAGVQSGGNGSVNVAGREKYAPHEVYLCPADPEKNDLFGASLRYMPGTIMSEWFPGLSRERRRRETSRMILKPDPAFALPPALFADLEAPHRGKRQLVYVDGSIHRTELGN